MPSRHFFYILFQKKAVFEHSVLRLLYASCHCHVLLADVYFFGSLLELCLDVSHLGVVLLEETFEQFFAFCAVAEVVTG